VFLGDCGSVPLGFCVGALGLWGWTGGAWPVWFPFLVFAPFFLDATATLLMRIATGQPFWRAHREHYYQRLIRSGWSHRRLALYEYVVMGASAVLATTMLTWSASAQYLGLAIACGVFLCIAILVDRRWLQFQQQDAKELIAHVDRIGGDALGPSPQPSLRESGENGNTTPPF